MTSKPQGERTIRILLVDDEALFREGLRLLLAHEAGFDIIGEASGCAEAVAIVTQEQPDIVLLDLGLGRESGIDCLRRITSASDRARVLVLTGVYDPVAHFEAVSRGARGVVRKLENGRNLIQAIRKVFAGEAWLDGMITARVLEEMWHAQDAGPRDTMSSSEERVIPDSELNKIAHITTREREIIALLGEGLSNKRIGERLYISRTTVRHHLSSIFNKLDVADRFELVVYAYRYRLAQLHN